MFWFIIIRIYNKSNNYRRWKPNDIRNRKQWKSRRHSATNRDRQKENKRHNSKIQKATATRIKDYLPEGLEFNVEDNPDWIKEEKGIISTDKLEKELIYPGETVEVEVILAWKNIRNNLGAKINIAEISEVDYEGKDQLETSKISLKKYTENDKSSSKIVIMKKTAIGLKQIYINIIIVAVLIILLGIVLTKILLNKYNKRFST